MIKESILEQLVCFTDEEIDHLNGKDIIDRSIYLSKNIIDFHKLMKDSQLITVRKHARFFHYPKHSHNYIEMSYVYGGSMTHIIDGKEVEVNEGEIILLNRDIEHEILKTGENDIIFNFIINPEFFNYISALADKNMIFDFILETIYSHRLSGQFLLFHCQGNQEIRSYIEKIITHVYEIEYTSPVKLKLLVGLLLMTLMDYPDLIESHENESYDRILCTSVLNYIHQNYKTASLQEISERLHQPDYRISKLMKENTGFTFKQHLLNVKMEVAVNLLENTGTAIYDIAEKIGYENLTHFYKLFKNKYHLTPRQYRENSQCKKG